MQLSPNTKLLYHFARHDLDGYTSVNNQDSGLLLQLAKSTKQISNIHLYDFICSSEHRGARSARHGAHPGNSYGAVQQREHLSFCRGPNNILYVCRCFYYRQACSLITARNVGGVEVHMSYYSDLLLMPCTLPLRNYVSPDRFDNLSRLLFETLPWLMAYLSYLKVVWFQSRCSACMRLAHYAT